MAVLYGNVKKKLRTGLLLLFRFSFLRRSFTIFWGFSATLTATDARKKENEKTEPAVTCAISNLEKQRVKTFFLCQQNIPYDVYENEQFRS